MRNLLLEASFKSTILNWKDTSHWHTLNNNISQLLTKLVSAFCFVGFFFSLYFFSFPSQRQLPISVHVLLLPILWCLYLGNYKELLGVFCSFKKLAIEGEEDKTYSEDGWQLFIWGSYRRMLPSMKIYPAM